MNSGAPARALDDPSSPTSVAPADSAAADKAAAAQASERVATASEVTFRGRTLAQLRGALIDFDASGSLKMGLHAPTEEDDKGTADLAQSQRAWFDFLEAKYNGYDEAALQRAKTDLAAIIEWQEQGPLDVDSDRLPKPTIEVLVRELMWLRDR